MKKILLLLLIFVSVQGYSQIETMQQNKKDIEMLKRTLYISGSHIERSYDRITNSILCMTAGTLIVISSPENTWSRVAGGVFGIASVGFSISALVNYGKAGKQLKRALIE